MKRLSEIQINQFQLALLFDSEQMVLYNDLLADNVFCGHCGNVAKKGITVEEVYLTNLNDIRVRGTCKLCNHKVSRIFEFGEDEAFYNKANDLRNSMTN